MPNTIEQTVPQASATATPSFCAVVVIWIDWYAYHVARFRGLFENSTLRDKVAGIEMVGGVGVHAGLKFREPLPTNLPVETLLPDHDWLEAPKWSLSRSLWRRLNQLNPDVVLVPGYYTLPALTAAAWAKLHRKKSVLMTESTSHDHTRSRWRETIKRLLINTLFDWAVAGGVAHVRYLEELNFPLNRVVKFYDVIENTFFHNSCSKLRRLPVPNKFNLPQNYFLYVGRLSIEKNIATLLSAFKEYKQQGGRWELVLVGDGPESPKLSKMASECAWGEEIHFVGLKATAELPAYYAFASAFVLPSLREPWGLVVNEAMAAGLPVLVSRRCGCIEDLVVEGINGFTFDPALVSELVTLLNCMDRLSSEERDLMGSRSYEIVRHYSPEAWAEQIAAIVRAQS